MLEKLAAELTRYMLSRGVISTEQEEIYGYGWALLLSRGYNGKSTGDTMGRFGKGSIGSFARKKAQLTAPS